MAMRHANAADTPVYVSSLVSPKVCGRCHEDQKEQYLRSAELNSEKAYDMSRAQYDVGQVDLLSVLQIQAKWIGARVGVVNITSNRLTQRVDLHLALGGSFEEAAE